MARFPGKSLTAPRVHVPYYDWETKLRQFGELIPFHLAGTSQMDAERMRDGIALLPTVTRRMFRGKKS